MAETEKNKVHYDLQNVYVAPLTLDDSDAATFGTPERLYGAVGMDLSAQGDTTTLRADGINYYVNTSNQGYQGDLTLAMVPDWFRERYLGQTVSTKDKVLVENAKTDQPKAFALLYEFQGDVHARRHVLYNCLAARPNVAGENKDNQREPDTEAMTITASPLPDGGVKASTTADTPETVYNNWTKAVWTKDSPS